MLCAHFPIAATMHSELAVAFHQLDSALRDSQHLWRPQPFTCDDVPWRKTHRHLHDALLNLSDELGFKIRELQHVLEGYKVSKEIAAHGVGGGTFIDWWGYKAEAYDAIPYNVTMMERAGVLTSVNSDSDELARRLNLDAAKAIKYGGLSEEEALKLCTLNPATQLRLDKRIG
jgi:hypothetical protein